MTSNTNSGSTLPPRYLGYPELSAYGIRYSRKHLLDLQRAGRFPQARQLSTNRVAWLQSEIIAYLESRPVSQAAHIRMRKPVTAPDEDALVRPENTETIAPDATDDSVKRSPGRPPRSRNRPAQRSGPQPGSRKGEPADRDQPQPPPYDENTPAS